MDDQGKERQNYLERIVNSPFVNKYTPDATSILTGSGLGLLIAGAPELRYLALGGIATGIGIGGRFLLGIKERLRKRENYESDLTREQIEIFDAVANYENALISLERPRHESLTDEDPHDLVRVREGELVDKLESKFGPVPEELSGPPGAKARHLYLRAKTDYIGSNPELAEKYEKFRQMMESLGFLHRAGLLNPDSEDDTDAKNSD